MIGVLLIGVPVALLVMPEPGPAIQILIGLFLVVLCIGADSEAGTIPAILRPAPVAFGSLTVASIAAGSLGTDYPEYFVLWVLQAFGMLAGFVFAPNLAKLVNRGARPVTPARFALIVTVIWVILLGFALLFFATQGVPALQSDLEQARVDAAEGGSGFIRMFAFLLPTATAAVVTIRGWRASWWMVAIALVVMLGYANRVPFIYFLFPLTVMIAVTSRKIGSVRIVGIASLLIVLMGALAAWRVYNTADMANSYLYREAVAEGDSLQIAWLAILHYVEVVPENAMMVKDFVDVGSLPLQFGSTYLTLFASALPGTQVSPDMMLKQLNGVDFIGGGIPPTLAGEGYMNLGYAGVFLNAFLAMMLLRYWASVVVKSTGFSPGQRRVSGLIYGYVLTWVCLAQISGFAGSATVSLAGFLLLVGTRWLGQHLARGHREDRTSQVPPAASVASANAGISNRLKREY